MQLVHLPAVRKRSLETLCHTALSVVTSRPRGVMRRSSSTPPTRRSCRSCGRAASRSRRTSTGWSGSAQVGPGRQALLPAGRAPRRPLVRRPHRRRAGHRGLLPRRVRRRRPSRSPTAHRDDARRRSDRRAGSESRGATTWWSPASSRRTTSLESSRATCAAGAAAAGRRRLRPVRRRLHRAHRSAAADRPGAVPGRGLGPELLDQLYANALTYLHGHSVGGTNPSLLRATGAGCRTLAYDVHFNREVLGDQARTGAVPSRSPRRSSGPKPTPMRWSPEARR